MQSLSSLYHRVKSSLTALDFYLLSLMTLFCVLALIFINKIPSASTILIEDSLIFCLIIALSLWVKDDSPYWMRVIRKIYIVPLNYPMYLHTQILVPKLNTALFDTELINIDFAIFGFHPTQALQSIATPILTEYLQICYVLFYLLHLIFVSETIIVKDMDKLNKFGRIIIFSYFVSYLGYFAFPAIGPRFTLHDFAQTDIELPGIALTPALREFVNVGGGIEPGTTNPADTVNRDCMPSGHTMMTVQNMILAWVFGLRMRWFLTIIGTSLVFSTVYLRYHYVIDVIVGIALALLMLWLEPRVQSWLKRKKLVKE